MRTEQHSDEGSNATAHSSKGAAAVNHSNGSPPMPKHIAFPEFSTAGGNSEVLNELVMFLFIFCASAMQFINIYRTIWHRPESFTNHAVNVFLIDKYLVVFIGVISVRRFLYCLLLRGLDMMKRSKQHRFYRKMLKYCFGGIIFAALGICIYNIYLRTNYLSFFLLVYPVIVYLLIFGFKIEPFLKSSCEVEGAYFMGMPLHCCSSNANTIRDEIELLKNDFNFRFKQVIFTAIINAYYAGFVPCFMAISVYYNILWATIHIIFMWFSGIAMSAMFLFPSKYCDILHRASLHLGFWTKMELRNLGGNGSLFNSSATGWSKNQVWPNNSLVKYAGELFRCQGPVTVALPNDASHLRFYKLFHNPSLIYSIMTTLQAALVLAGIILLYFAMEWHYVLSLSFITLTNQYSFFKIMRDFLITKKIYDAESSISERQQQQNSLHTN